MRYAKCSKCGKEQSINDWHEFEEVDLTTKEKKTIYMCENKGKAYYPINRTY